MLGIWTELPPEAPQGVNVVSQKAESPPPGLEKPVHWMGTDGTGRDILSRMIWGGRVSLSVGIVATAIELALGITLGALAGYFRGWVDVVISRVIEIVICFPSFFLILTIVAFLGPSIYNIMLVIGLTGWTGLARLVRGEFLKLSGQEFVLSARALGYKPARIIFRH
ncbi:MAG: ABC transporter permease, partial [Planctomycetaceae bacterium]|nr:ABC transporter permease [Planctomycetaceae bacterium]